MKHTYLRDVVIRPTSEGGFSMDATVIGCLCGVYQPGQEIAVNRITAIEGGGSEPFPLTLSTVSNPRAYRTRKVQLKAEPIL